ncbi:hypothetical protein P5673_030568 [Acropora cervicornis]|uniref:Uncharacterized protein n=1 Tax=Acropora cervicornis TaxID=6130 RepID=A0AAD9PU14_ACRCE|nr:hypothetical protein P5673_030568 [Acropora cervicornis]
MDVFTKITCAEERPRRNRFIEHSVPLISMIEFENLRKSLEKADMLAWNDWLRSHVVITKSKWRLYVVNVDRLEATVKMVRNFHFRTKNSPKWMILESRQRNEENGSPIKLHIEFYF